MRYFIDGYNFLFQSSIDFSSLQAGREAVISFLNSVASQKSLCITCVFDAHSQEDPLHKIISCGDIEIVFTGHGETADTYFANLFIGHKNPLSTLVTSDKNLHRRVAPFVATMSIQAFVGLLHKKKSQNFKRPPTKQKGGKSTPGLPPLTDLAAWEKIFTT